MGLIDADDIKKEIHRYALDAYCVNLENSKEFAGHSNVENYCEGLYEATELIDNLPTIEAEPVRHGHWIKSKDGYHRCSVCESRGSAIKARYCHHCGAKMDEVSE